MPWGDDRKKEGGGRNWGDEGEPNKNVPQSDGAKVDEFIARVDPMIDQLNNLYAMYFSGIELLPPNERRKQLEALMNQLAQMPKPNATYRFRLETLKTRFATFRDKWDRMMRDVESGKIKRSIKPKH